MGLCRSLDRLATFVTVLILGFLNPTTAPGTSHVIHLERSVELGHRFRIVFGGWWALRGDSGKLGCGGHTCRSGDGCKTAPRTRAFHQSLTGGGGFGFSEVVEVSGEGFRARFWAVLSSSEGVRRFFWAACQVRRRVRALDMKPSAVLRMRDVKLLQRT